jgi:hypothetical protein
MHKISYNDRKQIISIYLIDSLTEKIEYINIGMVEVSNIPTLTPDQARSNLQMYANQLSMIQNTLSELSDLMGRNEQD